MRRSLLDQFPADGTVLIDGEEFTTPYRVADGSMLLLAGTCELDAAADALAPLGLAPVAVGHGRALAALWVADFTQANLGPHGELQFSIFAAQSSAALSGGPWSLYQHLARTEMPWMVCHRLWNTTDQVVAYNDVHLGLEVGRADGGLRTDDIWRFTFAEMEGRSLARGAVQVPSRTSAADGWALTRTLGLRTLLRMSAGPSSISVVSPRRSSSGALQASQTFTRAASVVRLWNGADELELTDPQLAGLGFVPDLITAFGGLEFVYLRPQALAAE